jgi:hypothetical protein
VLRNSLNSPFCNRIAKTIAGDLSHASKASGVLTLARENRGQNGKGNRQGNEEKQERKDRDVTNHF